MDWQGAHAHTDKAHQESSSNRTARIARTHTGAARAAAQRDVATVAVAMRVFEIAPSLANSSETAPDNIGTDAASHTDTHTDIHTCASVRKYTRSAYVCAYAYVCMRM